MCGRYSLTATSADIQACFGLPKQPTLIARYNIAPTQFVPAVRSRADGIRELVSLRWGLLPSKTERLDNKRLLINARAETVASKPSFRSLFRERRCLVIADGFYEWRSVPASGKGTARARSRKAPYYVRLKSHQPFAFAGLWDSWQEQPQDGQAETVGSCTIITTDANEKIRPLHDRMPVVLTPNTFETWLDPKADLNRVRNLLLSPPADLFETFAVSTVVNSPANDRPECIVPAPEPLDLFTATQKK